MKRSKFTVIGLTAILLVVAALVLGVVSTATAGQIECRYYYRLPVVFVYNRYVCNHAPCPWYPSAVLESP